MNKLVTRFLFLSVLIGLCSPVLAQVASVHHQVVLPNWLKKKSDDAPFLHRRTFVPMGKPMLAPQGNTEALAYFDQNMIDGNGQLVDGSWSTVALPDTIQINQGQQSDGTYYMDHAAERFTSSFDNIYLDSVLVAFVADSVASRITSFVWQDTTNANGYPLPNVIFSKPLATSTILKASMKNDSFFTFYTIPFKHKLLATNPASPNSFYVGLSTLNSVSNPYADPRTNANRIRLLCDRTLVDAANPTQPDPEVDRSYYIRVCPDNTYVGWGPLAGSFGFDTDGDGQIDQLLYPNFFMIAYVSDGTDAVDGETSITNTLGQNFPNPFNPSTEIHYSLTERSNATLKVYNTLGREVATLVDGMVDAGQHQVTFHAENLPSGTYYYTLKAGEFSQTKRMVLAK